jgi:hypothetical protein
MVHVFPYPSNCKNEGAEVWTSAANNNNGCTDIGSLGMLETSRLVLQLSESRHRSSSQKGQ